MQAENGAGDDAERAKSAGDEFRQVVAGDIFHDFAAAAGQGAVGKCDGDADDQVAEGAEAQTQRAAVVGGENAADGGAFGPQAVEGEALAVLRERLLAAIAACSLLRPLR